MSNTSMVTMVAYLAFLSVSIFIDNGLASDAMYHWMSNALIK